jgi:GT2 family glycosyltransferase
MGDGTDTERPAVSVVLPFHGTRGEAEAALDALAAIALGSRDEVVVVDNSGAGAVPERAGVTVVAADAQHSSYYARNVGSARAHGEWLLFVDSDCRPAPDLVAAYFAEPIGEGTGAVVGEVAGAAGQETLVARYARSRGHLSQRMHWEFPFRPWGVTANLLVRRAAWADVGGFHEGIRSGGDTEFSWRLQDAGWTLEYRPEAVVEHEHRDSVRKLARQAARYAAGRAWVMRRYPGSLERPRLLRRLARCAAGVGWWTLRGQRDRAVFKALDAVYVVAECGAFVLSNTAPGAGVSGAPGRVVAVAGAFPDREDGTAVAAVRALDGARVEARSRPVRVDREAARELPIAYAEDDGVLRRLGAAAWLLARRPAATLAHVARRRRPGLLAVAPAARRVAATGADEVRSVGDDAGPDAAALAALAGTRHAG